MSPPTALLVGYNGANNTGAEALLQADIADLRAVLGPDARLTVPTLNAANLRRYLEPGPTLRIAPIPTIFFAAVRRLVRDHDLVVLVEGSAYMDTWTPALLWYFLWATHCADEAGKPSLAYAVDAGQLSRLDRWLTRRVASRSELIVTRAEAAAERLRSWGVTAPITATADNAVNFQPDPGDAAWLTACWPEGAGAVGLALVDFSRFPVVVRPWGRRQDCYRWPYYFAHSPARRRTSLALAEGYAALADRIVARHRRPVALIAMEELDEPLARAVQDRMRPGAQARVFSSREHDASQMTTLLRSLDLLVTSRYHAAVLSLAAAVPPVAVGHDLRLISLYQELGLADQLFIKGGASPEVFAAVAERVERLLADPSPVRATLRHGYQVHAAAARRNRELLREFALQHGWGEPAWAA
jgi:polysaccharide pyruvyl transferase WcaK-like protein